MFPLGKAVTSWTLLLFALIAQFHSGQTEGRVVCYYTNWSVYRPGTAKFNPQNINPYLCTHLIYAFGGFTKDNALKTFDKYQDVEQGGYAKFNGLKTFNKELKTLLAIGGWNEGSSRFSSLVASPQRRQEFVKNIIKFLRQNHFDGLDLDWEYPSFRGGKPRDRENYAQFVQELREEFELESSKTGRSRLLLTMAVPAGIEYIKKGYDVKKLNKYLDWFNLLSYDYHSAFEPSVNHHAPLYSLEEESEYNYDSDLNIDFSIKYYLNEGADRDKLVLGIPTYGRSYTLLNDEVTDIGAPTDGPGAQGDATREKGYLSYYEICQNIMEDPDWTVVQPDANKMGPYAFKDNQWVGYDDEGIARKKGEYVVANGLGGIMFWSIDNDDFRGLCHKRPYPIIEAAKEAMLNGLGLGDNEVVGPPSRKKPGRQRSRNTNKIQTQTKDDEEAISSNSDTSRRPQTVNRRRPSTTTTTERYTESKRPVSRTTTPEPPTTPDPGADFKCEDEGFYPHPRDCKKYFWCLDSGPSNLGIVAHQFTCPSGLVFNKITDSCDYTRNVQCTTKTSATTTTTKPTTNEPATTSSKSRTTVAPSRSTFLKRPSTTVDTRVIDEEEYIDEDEDEHKQLTGEEEEDPKVLKELIDIIKKLGGLEQLEKQLRQQGDTKTEQSPTAPTLISKSLYEKVLNSATGRNFLPNSRYTSTSTFGRNNSESVSSKPNKYSSVIRNSRPGPQNSGIERQDDVDAIQERPKYVTINRQSQRPNNKNDDTEDKTEDEESDEKETSFGYTTSQPQYVNIQRTRPSTTKSSFEDIDDDDDDVEPSTRRQYETLNRGKPFAVQNVDEESVTITTNRYKTIQRTRPSEATEQPEVNDTPVFINQGQQLMVSENDPVLTNTPETTTRTYANFARRTTDTTTEVNEQKTSPKVTTELIDKDFTDTTVRPEQQTDSPESVTVTADIDYTIDSNQNEVTTRTDDLETYSPTLINNNPYTPTNRPTTSSVDYSNDKTDQNKKVTTNTITTVGSFSKETQESFDSQTISPEFHGIVSSPRPFEFSKRTRRPAVRFTSSTVTSAPTTESAISPVSNKVSSIAYVASNPRRPIANLLLQRRENEVKVEQDQVSGITTVDDSNDSQEINVDTTRYIDSSTSASPNTSPSATTKYVDDSHETIDNSFNRPNRFRTKSSYRDETVTRPTTPRRQFASTEASIDAVTQSRRVIPRRKLRPVDDDIESEGPKQTTKSIVRPLRPTIEADLSSLTAGDFSKYSYVPRNTVRRVWPIRTTTTASTTVDYSNANGNDVNSVRSSSRRRPSRPSTESSVISENDGNKIHRVSQNRPLGRRRPSIPDQSNLEVLSQTSRAEDNSNSDSDSASNSQHFTISQDDFTEENVVTTNAPLKLTLERKLSFGSANNRFDTDRNHRLNINKYVSDSPIIFLNSRSTTRSPLKILHAEDAEQVSVRTDSSTLLNPLIYSVVIDNANAEDISTTSIDSVPTTTVRANLRRASYRTRVPSSDLNETSTEKRTDDGVAPRRLFKLKLDYGKHNEPDDRKSVQGVIVADTANTTRSKSGRKPFFRTISKSTYSELDEITEVSSVDSSILSREEGQFEFVTQDNGDEYTTISPKSENDDLSYDLIKEIDSNQIYQNTPVGLLNPLLAFNLIDTTLTPDSTQPESTDAHFDGTEATESYRTESLESDAFDDITTEPFTESTAIERNSAKTSERVKIFRGKVKPEVDEDIKTSTNRRPTYRGRASSTTESNTEINEKENDGDVTESTDRRPTPRRNNRRPYQGKNEITSEQEINNRRTSRRPFYRNRIASTTEAIDGRNESSNDDVQPTRHVIRRPALAGRVAVNSDEEDSTGNKVQFRRRRPIKGSDDETSTPLRNRVRRPHFRPGDGFDDDEEKQTNLRNRVRRPIFRPSLTDQDVSDESTESSTNENLRSDSESISLIRSSGRIAIAQIFDEIAATDENVDTATFATDDLNPKNRIGVPSNTEIEDKIRTQNEATTNGSVNRRRKVIRRLRPSSTTEQSLNDGVSNESSSIAPRRKVVRKLIRRPSTSETPYHEENGNIELLPVRGTFGPHDSEKLNSSEEDKEQVSNRRGKSKLFPEIGDDTENYYDNDVFSNDNDKNNDTDADDDEYEVNDEDDENQTNNKATSSTTPKSLLNSRLFASRAPFSRPTRPTVEHVASTVDSVTSPKSYVRKYSSKFVSPNQPPVEDNSDEVSLIGTVKPFVVHENLNRYRSSFKKEKEEENTDVELNDGDDDEVEEDLPPSKNVKSNYVPRRPSNRPFSNQGIREDYEEDEQQEVDFKFSSKPTPLRKQNRPFALKDVQSDTEPIDEKPLVRPSPFNRPKYFIPSKKEENDILPEQETETEDKSNSPYKPKQPRVRTSLPTGTTKSSRKQNNPYTNKKFTSTSSETSSSNPLLDDLDRNALNSRNKKIFEKSSKKHLILNPSTQHQHESIDQTNTSNTSPSNSENSEYYTEDYTLTMSTNDGEEYSTLSEIQFDDTTQDNLLNTINFNEFQEATTEDQSVVFKIGRPTTTPKPTTLHHIFAIDYDEKTEMIQMPLAVEEKTSEVISQRVEKIAEVSRVVEIYSQQETHSNNGDNKSTQSNLVLEKLPTVNKLGEISRITLIKLVDQNNKENNNSLNEITKPTTLSHLEESKRHAKSIQKLISPETIFSVETSTIPLEALFQNERTSKVLSASDKIAETAIPNSTTTTDADKNQTNEIFTTDISPTKHVIQIEPQARPLVISLANLDKVVLSKLTNKSPSAGNDSDVHSTGKVSTNIDAPHVVVASNETSNTDSTVVDSIDPIVNTQTSYSSEISRVVKKSPKVTEPGADQPIVDGLEQTEAQPSKKIRPNFRPNFRRPSFTTKKTNTTVSNDVLPTTESIVPTYQANRRRRPTTTTATSTTSTGVLTTPEPSIKNSIKRKYSARPNIDRRKYSSLSTTKTTTSTTTELPATRTEPSRTTNKFFRRRFNYFSTTTKQPPKNTTTTESSVQDEKNRYSNADQKIEPSILDTKFVNNRFNQIGEPLKDDGLIEAITAAISKAPLPVSVASTTSRYSNTYSFYNQAEDITDSYNTDEPITKRTGVNFSTRRTIPRRVVTTTTTTTTPQPRREFLQRRRPQPFERTQRLDFQSEAPVREYKPIHHDYDYYDDGNLGIVDNHSHHSKIKVILHDFGIIECLDQGNFPHPLSCRKFITCAKMEIGGVVGWEYTCPKELSFDPVGGMCNYSAGLGCKDGN